VFQLILLASFPKGTLGVRA